MIHDADMFYARLHHEFPAFFRSTPLHRSFIIRFSLRSSFSFASPFTRVRSDSLSHSRLHSTRIHFPIMLSLSLLFRSLILNVTRSPLPSVSCIHPINRSHSVLDALTLICLMLFSLAYSLDLFLFELCFFPHFIVSLIDSPSLYSSIEVFICVTHSLIRSLSLIRYMLPITVHWDNDRKLPKSTYALPESTYTLPKSTYTLP